MGGEKSAPSVLIFLSSFFAENLHADSKMSKLESAMDTLLDVFQYYSSKEGDKFLLNGVELRNLLRGELSQYLQASRDPVRVKQIMSELDTNLDGRVSFEEFVVMVTRLTVCSRPFFQDYTPVIIQCGQMQNGQFKKF